MTNDQTDSTLPMKRVPSANPRALVSYLQVLKGSATGQILKLTDVTVLLGRDSLCDLVLDDAGVSRKHAHILWDAESNQYVVVDLNSTNGTFLGEQDVTRAILKNGDRVSLGELADVKYGEASVDEVELAIRHFEGATRDALTRALNRGSWFERAEQELAIAKRQNSFFTLVMLDLDHFKKINDTFGHPAGDAVLRSVGDIIRQQHRLEDILGRYGGEEFILLLRGTDSKPALVVAERIREAVAAKVFRIPVGESEQEHRVSASLGVAAWRSPETLQGLVARADAALYQAKQGGRNQVVVAAIENATPTG